MGARYLRPERIADLDDRFAGNLRAARERLGLSRPGLAARSGVPEHCIKEIEIGHGRRAGTRRRSSIGEAIVLAEALGLKPGDLLKERAVTDA